MVSNCIASSSIGCLLCFKGCNPDKLRNAFTFIPPSPSYAVEADEEDRSKGKMVYLMDGLISSQLYRQAAEASEVRWVTTRKGYKVPVVWVHRQPVTKMAARGRAGDADPGDGAASEGSDPLAAPIVLLHCHGNATDIGMMMGPYYELAKVLGIEVVGVEYSGYGAANGKPSSGNSSADLEAAYDLVAGLGVPPKRIVAYGQSIGSGPVAALAAKRQLGGIILHSPLLSGIKVIDPQPDSCCRPSCVWYCFDFYRNEKRIRSLACPAFIMHGQRDDIIPFYHGYRLHKACPKGSRWPAYFPARAGHNDLVETDMRMYFGEISNFLQDLKKLAAGLPVEPPLTERPQQVEMGSKSAPASMDGRGGGVPGMTGNLGGEFIGAAPEPKAGPEDGRYEQLRQGKVRVPGGMFDDADHSPAQSCDCKADDEKPQQCGPPAPA